MIPIKDAHFQMQH